MGSSSFRKTVLSHQILTARKLLGFLYSPRALLGVSVSVIHSLSVNLVRCDGGMNASSIVGISYSATLSPLFSPSSRPFSSELRLSLSLSLSSCFLSVQHLETYPPLVSTVSLHMAFKNRPQRASTAGLPSRRLQLINPDSVEGDFEMYLTSDYNATYSCQKLRRKI